MRLRTLSTVVVIIAATVVADGQQHEAAADWQQWLTSRAASFSGVALIARGEAVVATGAFGVADRASGRRITTETRFNLGSINKTFTALAIAQLIQRRRLSLDDTVAKHLPDYPNAAAAARITVRDLIRHRSGVAVFMRAEFGDVGVAEMTKTVGAAPMSFEPGARQEYSNGGYIVLGRIVEVVSGQDYSSYVADHISRPAGMTATGFAAAGQHDAAIALGYFAADAQGQPMMGGKGDRVGFRPPQPGNPAGGGYATASDLFKFARALREGRLLDRKMTEYVLHGTFAEPGDARFGFALREQLAGNRRFIGNGGGAPGVNAEFRFEPAGEYTVVVLANSSPPAATQLLNDILTRLAG